MQTDAMARGLQIITSDEDAVVHIPPDDLVLLNPQRMSDQPVVEHPLPSLSDLSIASNAPVDHNANSHAEGSILSDQTDDESSDIIADYGDAHESYASYLTTSRTLPSLQETRSAGQILFTQFCRQHLPAATPLQILEDAIPDQVQPDVNQLMQYVTHPCP